MVHGEVRAPLLDLANRDLISSHLHAVWLASSRHPLPKGISEVLDLSAGGTQAVLPEVMDPLSLPEVAAEARERSIRVLGLLTDELDPARAPWFDSAAAFADRVIDAAGRSFDRAFERWRSLYQSALHQRDQARRILDDHTQPPEQQWMAKREQAVATDLLLALQDRNQEQSSDFNLYRYLATEGFLPGYNFPRLPLLACIPGEREKDQAYVQRPRFLALSEFGPKSLLYHEGRTYRVVKVRLGGRQEGTAPQVGQLAVQQVRVCTTCGGGHLETHRNGCHACGASLGNAMLVRNLLRIEHVDTRPTERITADDEERQRQGFELVTTFRWAERGDGPSVRTVRAADAAGDVLLLQYGSSATITRINLGLRRRKERSSHGFDINPSTGWWGRGLGDDDSDGPNPGRVAAQRVVPFVQDQKNALLLRFFDDENLSATTRATFQHAVRRAIELVYQLEEGELLVEPLPDRERRRGLLFYEATEGGAGVLTRLVHEPDAMARVAHEALRLMHLDLPDWRADATLPSAEALADTPDACVRACYRCVLSYFNQPDHDAVDRTDIPTRRLLLRLAQIATAVHDAPPSLDVHDVLIDPHERSPWLIRWEEARAASGITLPAWTIAGNSAPRWAAAYAAVVLADTPAALKEQLENEGTTLFSFPADVGRWPDLFLRLSKYLESAR
jgi:hypothetical protein